MNPGWNVLYLVTQEPSIGQFLRALAPPDFVATTLDPRNPSEIKATLHQTDFVMAGGMTAVMIRSAPKLKLIQTLSIHAAAGDPYDLADCRSTQSTGVE